MQKPTMTQNIIGFAIATAIVSAVTAFFRSRKANTSEA